MSWVIGVDGGGTKSICMLADVKGNIIGSAVAGCSNHQLCGMKRSVRTLSNLIESVLSNANLSYEQVSHIQFGLAGADLESDIKQLEENLTQVMHGIPFTIVNDIWLPFRASSAGGWGAISICGTGSNFAVKLPDGKQVGVRSLGYTLGSRGGGLEISDYALHYAFRSNEHTGKYTRLEEFLPAFCDVLDMNDLALKVYESKEQYHHKYNISKLVMDLAEEGDEVCQEILKEAGETLGEMLGRLTVSAGLQDATVPLVLGGSIYRCRNRFLEGGFFESFKRFIPSYELFLIDCEPVAGAVLLALEKVGVFIDNTIFTLVRKQVESFHRPYSRVMED